VPAFDPLRREGAARLNVLSFPVRRTPFLKQAKVKQF
jgi:hypothetical protein